MSIILHISYVYLPLHAMRAEVSHTRLQPQGVLVVEAKNEWGKMQCELWES